MNSKLWLEEIIKNYKKYKSNCEKAAEQVSDENFFKSLAGNPQSIAVLIKHIGGNLRSRLRNFLTTDGEKSDRNRETEFTAAGETRESIYEKWEEGWRIALDTLSSLGENDLEKTVTIRGEPFTVIEALERNLNHVVYHTGQIVFLARAFAGEDWKTLSVDVGKSEEYNAKMKEKYGDWMKKGNNE